PGGWGRGLEGIVEKQHPHLLQAAGQGGQELRPVYRKRLRDAFVGPTLARAFGIELRIVLIGAHQRFGERLRPHRLDQQRAHGGDNDRRRTARTKDAAYRGQRSDDARLTVRTQNAERYAIRHAPNFAKSAWMPPRNHCSFRPRPPVVSLDWLGKGIISLKLRLKAVRIPAHAGRSPAI